MKKKRAKKPLALVGKIKKEKMIFAEVYEKIYKVEGPVGDDLRAARGAVIMGGGLFSIDTPNKEQAAAAMKLSKWLFKYSRWIASRPEGKV